MSIKLAILFIVLVALGWAAMGGLIASLWDEVINVLARRRSKDKAN